MLDDIIMILFINTTEKQGNSMVFSKIKHDKIYLYKPLQKYSRKQSGKKMSSSHHYFDKNRNKNINGLLSIIIEKGELRNRTNKWLFHISGINKEHSILP